MHQALYINELLVNIFNFLCIVDYLNVERRREANTSLASLARTCRTFSEPALNCLWHTQTSLRPVLRLFFDSTIDAAGVDKFTPEPTRELVRFLFLLAQM